MSKSSDAGDTFLPEAPEKDIQQANENKNTVGEEPAQATPDGTTWNRARHNATGSDNCNALTACRNRARRVERTELRTDSAAEIYAAHHAMGGQSHE
jgi:hypothetical protein